MGHGQLIVFDEIGTRLEPRRFCTHHGGANGAQAAPMINNHASYDC